MFKNRKGILDIYDGGCEVKLLHFRSTSNLKPVFFPLNSTSQQGQIEDTVKLIGFQYISGKSPAVQKRHHWYMATINTSKRLSWLPPESISKGSAEGTTQAQRAVSGGMQITNVVPRMQFTPGITWIRQSCISSGQVLQSVSRVSRTTVRVHKERIHNHRLSSFYQRELRQVSALSSRAAQTLCDVDCISKDWMPNKPFLEIPLDQLPVRQNKLTVCI